MGFITGLFIPSSGVGEQQLIVPSEVKCPWRRVLDGFTIWGSGFRVDGVWVRGEG
jgi:hypothetical protein